MERFLKTAHLRKLEKQVIDGEISYSRMIEDINFEAYKFFVSKQQKQIDLKETMMNVVKHLMTDDFRKIYADKWTNEEIANAMIKSMVVMKNVTP